MLAHIQAQAWECRDRNSSGQWCQTACTLPGEDTVEEEFDEFKGGGVGADIAGKANPVATNGDTGSVRVILLRTNFTDNHSMTDLLALVEGDV
jgi:hypothetical protein